MAILLCLVLGALLGWIGSLLMRTGTSEAILIDIAAGAVAAVTLALLLAGSTTFDRLVAGSLGSVTGLTLLYFVRRTRRGGTG